MLIELIRLALNNLSRARVRLAMTSAGVVIGTVAVVMLIALSIGLQTVAEAGIGSNALLTEITVYDGVDPDQPQEPLPLTAESLQQLESLAGVAVAVPILTFEGRSELQAGVLRNYPTVFGVDAERFTQLNVEVAAGQFVIAENAPVVGASVPTFFVDPNATEWNPEAFEVLGAPLRFQVTSRDGDHLRNQVMVNGVLGASTSRFDSAILLPLEQVIGLNAWIAGERADPESVVYDQIIVRTTGRDVTGRVGEAIQQLGYETDGIGSYLDEINNFFGTMRVILGAVGGIALFVAAVGVGNTMSMTIIERTREIGLMKAIGARDRDVLLVFLAEAGLVGFIGGAIGVLVSLFIGDRINEAVLNAATSGAQGLVPLNFGSIQGSLIVIPVNLMVFAVALSTLVGVVAGVLPAYRAARLSPVHALKYE